LEYLSFSCGRSFVHLFDEGLLAGRSGQTLESVRPISFIRTTRICDEERILMYQAMIWLYFNLRASRGHRLLFLTKGELRSLSRRLPAAPGHPLLLFRHALHASCPRFPNIAASASRLPVDTRPGRLVVSSDQRDVRTSLSVGVDGTHAAARVIPVAPLSVEASCYFRAGSRTRNTFVLPVFLKPMMENQHEAQPDQ